MCPTYNRAPSHLHLLSECVESFRRQGYDGPKELVILNDAREQFLVCDVPGVHVVNLPARIPSLGAKFNALVELARYDLLMPAEDDDVWLGHRVSQAVEMLASSPAPGYWKPSQVAFLDQRGLHFHHNVGVRHHASIFTRAAWKRVGGYPAVSGNQDALMDQRLGGHLLPAYPAGIPPQEFAYLYRWGCSPNHLSGNSDPEAAWLAEALKPVQSGTFAIIPKWRQNYAELCRKALLESDSSRNN